MMVFMQPLRNNDIPVIPQKGGTMCPQESAVYLAGLNAQTLQFHGVDVNQVVDDGING